MNNTILNRGYSREGCGFQKEKKTTTWSCVIFQGPLLNIRQIKGRRASMSDWGGRKNIFKISPEWVRIIQNKLSHCLHLVMDFGICTVRMF